MNLSKGRITLITILNDNPILNFCFMYNLNYSKYSLTYSVTLGLGILISIAYAIFLG